MYIHGAEQVVCLFIHISLMYNQNNGGIIISVQLNIVFLAVSKNKLEDMKELGYVTQQGTFQIQLLILTDLPYLVV